MSSNTSNEHIAWYINYTLIKLSFKKAQLCLSPDGNFIKVKKDMLSRYFMENGFADPTHKEFCKHPEWIPQTSLLKVVQIWQPNEKACL